MGLGVNIGIDVIGGLNQGSLPWYQQGDFAGIDWGDNFGLFQFQNDLYTKDGSSVLLPDIMTSTHSTDILALNDSGTYDTFAPNEIVRNDKGLHEVPASRTNLNANFQASASTWSNVGLMTKADTTLTSLGIFTGGVVVATGGQIWHRLAPPVGGFSANTDYPMTFFYKAGTSGKAQIELHTTQTTPTTSVSVTGTAGALAVTNQGNGTVNIIKQILHADGTHEITIVMRFNESFTSHTLGIGPYSNVAGENIIVMGSHVEEGEFATTPIITAGAAGLRTGARNVMSGLTLETGVDCSCVIDVKSTSTITRLFTFNDGTGANRVIVGISGGNVLLLVITNNASQGTLNLGSIGVGLHALTLSLSTNFMKFGVVGKTSLTDTSVIFPNVSKATFLGEGLYNAYNQYGTMKETYWRAGSIANDASFAEFETLAQARLTANGG